MFLPLRARRGLDKEVMQHGQKLKEAMHFIQAVDRGERKFEKLPLKFAP